MIGLYRPNASVFQSQEQIENEKKNISKVHESLQ